jgi:hydrogenase maturation protease
MNGGWTVLACGDANRGDDGAALVAIEHMPRRLPPGVKVRHCSQLEPDELVAALLGGPCIVIDTVHGVPPGALVELPLRDLLSGDGPTPASSHALPMPIIVGLAAALGAPLDRGCFIGIGGATFGLGDSLSPAVAAGIDIWVRTILRHLPSRSRSRCA